MTSTTSGSFPLATEDPYTGGQDSSAGSANSGGSIDNEAGAAGGTSGAVELSHGALVAIIIVVVLVAVGGSTSWSPLSHSRRANILTNLPSRIGGAVLFGEEEGMEDQREHPTLGQKGRDCLDASTLRIPAISQGIWQGITGSCSTRRCATDPTSEAGRS